VAAEILATGRVLQVNTSGGGVPKLPVARAWVGELGLQGDEHTERTLHGGPHKAVCLFGIEAIERLRSEGHPVEPGSVGENLTTAGIEWSTLPIGARARIGESLEIEVASPAMPCSAQRRNFHDGRFSRMSIALHPTDSRMYARVLREGEVRVDDPITVRPPAPESRAADEFLLKRLDRAETKSGVASWRAAAESGYVIDIVEDGDIALSSSVTLAGPPFNQASGFARYPNLLELATSFYDRHRATGWLWMEDAPWPGSVPAMALGVFATQPSQVAEASPRGRVTVRVIGPTEAVAFSVVRTTRQPADASVSDALDPWVKVYEKLADWPHRYLVLAELDGKPAGGASLHVHANTGWLRGAMVAPEMRGRGIQRAMIAARVQKAIELGCDLVGLWAEMDGPSSANLARMGFRNIAMRRQYRYDPPSGANANG